MKSLLFICFFSFSLIFAQSGNKDWYIGLQTGVGNSFRTLQIIEGGNGSELVDRKRYETPQTAFNTNILFGKKLTHHLWLEGGYGFSRLSYLYKQEFPQSTYYRTTFYYNNDISVSLKIYTNKGKFRGFIFAGPEANIIINWRETKVNLVFASSSEPLFYDYTPKAGHNWLAFSMQGGAGLSYQLNNRLSLETRFILKQNVIPSRIMTDLEERLNYKAVNMGILIALGKG